jgi:predicted lipase
MKLAKTSIALLIVQLAIVSTIAAKYLYQRSTCPRVWTRTAAYDPELVIRGRYLTMQLVVDGCQSTLPSAKQANFPRNINGVPNGMNYAIAGPQTIYFAAKLAVKDNKLVAFRIPESDDRPAGQMVSALPGLSCENLRLQDPVDFYIPEHAQSPLPLKQGDELWIEVTVPPKGPPRPIQLALKQNGIWKPLAIQ